MILMGEVIGMTLTAAIISGLVAWAAVSIGGDPWEYPLLGIVGLFPLMIGVGSGIVAISILQLLGIGVRRFESTFRGVRSGWLDGETLPLVERAVRESQNDSGVCPSPELILEAYRRIDPKDVCVVIVGWDPYPRLSDACGVAFQALSAMPHSARSIFDNLAKYGHVSPDHRAAMTEADLRGWIEQGVLLTNRSLTVIAGRPGSHAAAWTGVVERILSRVPKNTVALLLGAEAGLLSLPCERVVRHTHPVIPSDDEFQKVDCFGMVNAHLKELGHAPIDWSRHAISS